MASPLPPALRVFIAVVGGTVAVVSSIGLGGYFLVNSTAGPSLLEWAMGGPSPLTVERIQWGPDLSHVAFIQPRVTNYEGRTTIRAQAAWVRMSGLRPRSMVLLDAAVISDAGRVGIGAQRLAADLDLSATSIAAFRLSRLRADGYILNMRWLPDPDGQGVTFNLSRSFRFRAPSATPPKPKPRPPGPPRDLPWFRIDDITLADGELYFEWPSGSYQASNVTAKGAYGTEPWTGIVIDADLTGGSTTWTQRGLPEPLTWDGVEITGYTMRGPKITTDALALEAGTGDIDDHVRLHRVSAGPEGASADVDLAFGKRLVGPFKFIGAATDFAFDLRPGLVAGLVTGKIVVHHAAAERVEGPEGVVLEKPLLRSLDAELGTTSSKVRLGGFASRRIRWLTKEIFDANVSGTANVSFTSGSFQGTLDTLEHGTLTVDGDIDVSLLRQRATFLVKLSASAIRGALAALVSPVLGSDKPPPWTTIARFKTYATLSELFSGRWRPNFEVIEPAGEVPR